MKFSSLSGTKRKESPTRSTHHPRLKHQQPFHGSLNHEVQTGACDVRLNVCCILFSQNTLLYHFFLSLSQSKFIFQVKPSNDASLPKPLPGPSSIKFPSLSGTKRKESPTRSTDYLCLQHQQPFHGSRNHEMKTGATDFSLNVGCILLSQNTLLDNTLYFNLSLFFRLNHQMMLPSQSHCQVHVQVNSQVF